MKYKIKTRMAKIAAGAMAGMLVFGLAGCKNQTLDGDGMVRNTEDWEETTESKQDLVAFDFAEEGVLLPEDFESMIYPVKALVLQNYLVGSPYYTSAAAQEDADSVWFSLACLTSLMEGSDKEDYHLAEKTEDGVYYVDDETISMYASALYGEYAKGNMEFPELYEEDDFAFHDEEKDSYGFFEGDISDYRVMISSAEIDGSHLVITADLYESFEGEEESLISNSKLVFDPSVYDGTKNLFSYSASNCISTMADLEMEIGDSESEDDEYELDEEFQDMMEDMDEEDGDEEEFISLTEEDAEDMASEYYGEDYEYKYVGMTELGDYVYYDFEVIGDDMKNHHVLVSESGEDVIGGKANADGTWSFDE